MQTSEAEQTQSDQSPHRHVNSAGLQTALMGSWLNWLCLRFLCMYSRSDSSLFSTTEEQLKALGDIDLIQTKQTQTSLSV